MLQVLQAHHLKSTSIIDSLADCICLAFATTCITILHFGVAHLDFMGITKVYDIVSSNPMGAPEATGHYHTQIHCFDLDAYPGTS